MPASGSAAALDIDAVVPYLIRIGLVDAAAVAASEIIVRGLPSRHQAYHVEIDDTDGFFVKHADGLVPRDREVLAAEAEFHEAAARHGPGGCLAPELVRWDSETSVLITRLLVGYRSLRDEVRSRPPQRVPIGYWRLIGEALARCHEWPGPEGATTTPSVWTTFRPDPAHLATLTLGELAVFQVLRESSLRSAVASLQDAWQPTAFCHGDIRPENVLVIEREDERDVRLVDWELSGLSDPLWDLAGALAAVMTLTLGRRCAGDLDVPVVQAASRAAWSGYLSQRLPEGRPGGTTAALAQLIAARLMVSALESAAMVNRLTPDAVSYLQIAENILQDPHRAVVGLLALDHA